MTRTTPDSALRTLTRPIVDENPILLQVLGICSALAVTRSLATALTMAGAVTGVLIASNVIISAIRRQIPRSIRLIVQITIIASLVIVVDQLLAAFAWEMSKQLTVFVSLIVTNCIVLGRAESFAMNHPVRESALDGLGNGLGFGLVLAFVAALRELIGAGTLLGSTVLPLASEGGWYVPARIAQLPPSAFFIIALVIWVVRAARPGQVEPRAWSPADDDEPTSRRTGPWIS